MSQGLREHLDALERVGWKVIRREKKASLPDAILERYGWVARGALDLVCEIEVAESADQKAWILSAGDYSGTSGSAFAWNEWELLSLNAAEDDEDWKAQISEFWDEHFPLFMSVKSGYAYFAIERQGGAVVVGEEPDFGEASPLAASVAELLQMIAARDPRLERWV